MVTKLSQGFVALCCALMMFGCVDAEQAASTDEVMAATEDAQLDITQQRIARLTELDLHIRRTVGIPRAGEMSQCKLLEVGVRACGGPEYYMAYSTLVTDEAALLDLVEEYNQLRREHIRETNEVSTCDMIPPPKLVFEEGMCRAVATSYM